MGMQMCYLTNSYETKTKKNYLHTVTSLIQYGFRPAKVWRANSTSLIQPNLSPEKKN